MVAMPKCSPTLVTAPAVPLGLLTLYFLHAFLITFPGTAYNEWLFDVVHMPPATTAIYYSVTFFPWNLKPLYGLVSDSFPVFGYHRKPYIVLCELGTALTLLLTGTYVRSVAGAFAVKLLDAVCEAFAQIMLGILLVDLTSGDNTSKSSARVQSLANTTKNAASVAALLCGIPVYKDRSLAPQLIISWSAVLPLLAALVCLFGLHETRVLPDVDARAEWLAADGGGLPTSRWATFREAWRSFKGGVRRKMDALAPVLPAMLFFFLCSALPDDGTVWYQYTYGLLENSLECVQYMSLSGMVGRFLSCLAYARWCSNRNVRQVFLLSTVSCVAAGLPRLLLAPPVAPLPVSVCTFLTAESFVTGFTAEFALLQLLVVATFYCPSGKDVQGLTYALFLSFMDFGGVVSGLLASAVVTALGIVPDPVTKRIDWSNLWLVVVIAAASQLLVLVFLCVLPEKVHTEDRGYRSPSADGTEKLPLLAHADGVDYDRLEDDRRA